MKRAIIIGAVLILTLNLSAEKVSVKKAMFYSALLPGWGQAYTQNYTKAGFFLAAEAGTYLAWFRLSKETDWAVDAYKDYAYNMVGIDLESNKDYYQLIQDNFSSDLYNASVERYARNVFLIIYNDPEGYEDYIATNFISEELSWDWENNKNWDRYKDLRYTKQNFEVYENFAVAALILNRLVSSVDAAIAARNVNRNIESKDFGSLNIAPDFAKSGMRISYEIKF